MALVSHREAKSLRGARPGDRKAHLKLPWGSLAPCRPSSSITAHTKPSLAHPSPPSPYLGVQGAQESIQLHVEAAAADVDGGFQDLAEALLSERRGCS